MAAEYAVCRENCYDSTSNTYYRAGVAYQVDTRNPLIQRHFVTDNRAVDKALEKAEKSKK